MSSNEDLTKNHHEKEETKNQEFLRQRQLTCCCSHKVSWKASSQFHPPPPLPLFSPVPAVLPSSLAPSATILLFCFHWVWKWSGPSFSVLTKQKAILFRGRNSFYADTASYMTSQRVPARARAKTGHGVSRLWVCHEWDEWGEALLGLPSWFGSCIYTLVTWAVAGPGTITRPALLEYHGAVSRVGEGTAPPAVLPPLALAPSSLRHSPARDGTAGERGSRNVTPLSARN